MNVQVCTECEMAWRPGRLQLNWPLSDKRIINCINKSNTASGWLVGSVRRWLSGQLFLFPGRHSVAAFSPSRSHWILASASSSFVPSVLFQQVSGKSKNDCFYAIKSIASLTLQCLYNLRVLPAPACCLRGNNNVFIHIFSFFNSAIFFSPLILAISDYGVE